MIVRTDCQTLLSVCEGDRPRKTLTAVPYPRAMAIHHGVNGKI